MTLDNIPQCTIKSFGAFGSKYEVCEPLRPLADGDWMVKVKIIDSGEAIEYRRSHLRSHLINDSLAS